MAPFIDPVDLAVAVGLASDEPASERRRLHAAKRLLLKLRKEDRLEHGSNRELHVVDLVLRDRVKPDLTELQLLSDPGDVLRIAGDAVERLAHDDVDPAVPHVAEHPLKAWTVPTVA
ncbi:hypothetical protein ASF00_08470 [Sphingomonas sp. Leaf34]|nr:hypothetical protein [Sphingomonas sp. Leaf34]KQN30716.1 hypothetical protein ASF00_08470 [Sphingomonas sp. Leaf34]